MPTVQRERHSIYYEERGGKDKPPLLLIMGLALSSRAWDTLPQKLESDFRVIVFDNRGAGRSTRPPGLFRIAEMADDAAAVLDAAGVGAACVFGVSMGGMIALELVLRHPRRVRALMLGCTHARWLSSVKPERGVVGKVTLATLFSDGLKVERAKSFLVSPESYAQDPERFARWLKQSERAPLPSVLAQLGAIVRHHAEDRLSQISTPTLVITGTADRLVPRENSHRLARAIRGARLVELEGAGHCFPFEREPETVAAARAHFLGGA